MAKAIDPVCQMEVDTENPPGGKDDYRGTTYYFCAPACKRTFEKAPDRYLSTQTDAAPKKGFFSRLFGRQDRDMNA